MKYSAACLAAFAASGVVLADGTTDTPTDTQIADLTRQVSQLQAQLESMQSGDNWLHEQRDAEIAEVVRGVLADADQRASFLQSSSGPKVSGQIQFRYVYNLQDDNAGPDTNRSGFEMRRTKIAFTGDFNERWSYDVTGAFSRSSGLFELETAEIYYDLGNGWEAQFGQDKAPFMREELISSKRQLAVDRSLVNEEFNQDRSQHVQLNWSGEQMRWMASINDGINGDNVAALTEDVEFAATARIEFLGYGEWKQFRDFTSPMGSANGLLLGAAAHYQLGEYGTATANEVEDVRLTADMSWEGDGMSLFGAYVYQMLDDDAALDTDRSGFVVQGSLYLSEHTEIFARYEWGDYDTTGVEDLSVVTVGFNRYFDSHKIKWTTDVGFGLEEVAGPWSTSGAGYRTDAVGEDGQIVIRSQLQLLF